MPSGLDLLDGIEIQWFNTWGIGDRYCFLFGNIVLPTHVGIFGLTDFLIRF